MQLYIPQSLRRIPPIILPLLAYIASSSLFWVISSTSFTLSSSLWILVFLLSVRFLYSQIPSSFFVLIILASLLGVVRNYQISSYFNTFPFEQAAKGVKIEAMVREYLFKPANRFPHCYTLSVHKIISNGIPHFIPCTIQIYTRQKGNAETGDTIEIDNIYLKKQSDNSFSFYLMKEGIIATAFQEKLSFSILSHPSFSISRWLSQKRKALLRLFQKSLSSTTFGLFAAVFFGEKELIKKDKALREELFKKWGIVHYLARSGLHLVILVSLWEIILKCLPIAFILKQLMILIIVLFYFLLTWPSISFIRAFIIFLMYKYCLVSRTPNHFLHLLLLCCFILLLINPLYLFFLDFQLSFGLTFALGWLNLFRTASPKEN